MAHASHAISVPMVQSFHGVSGIGESGARPLRALRDVCAITAASVFLKRYFANLSTAARDARVIIHGVDAQAAELAQAAVHERPYIFSAGRLHLPTKAFDVLIAAFATLATRYPQLDLLIAGDGPDRAALEAQIAAARLGDHVTMPGAKPQSELWSLYKSAIMFAMPSRAREGLGLVFLEAMACGTPVIATGTGGTPEIVINGETGLLVEHNEPVEIAAAMAKLIDNPELRSRMGQAGRELAAQYSWRRVAERYLEVFAFCLGSHQARSSSSG
jgi:glycosyltransferase involved in cell wall biosynthesis